MSQLITSKRRSAVPAAVLLLVACLALAACGGSSGNSSSSNAAKTTTSAATKANGPAGAKRFAPVRECLQKNGITLPKRSQGQRPPNGGGLLGGAGGQGKLPAGVTRAQYEAAIKKCGGFGGRFGAGGGTAPRLNTPAFKAALSKFAACMRENGVNVPAPNTSGKGPVFNTNGLNPTSAKFKAAQTKCASVLRGAFRAQPGAAGGPPGAVG